MKVTFNPNICTTQYKRTPHKQAVVSFGAVPKKVSSSELLDIVKKTPDRIASLIMEERQGNIAPIDWNIKDRAGNNILMLLAQQGGSIFTNQPLEDFIEFVNKENRINVNYVNEIQGYSLTQCVLKHRGNLGQILQLKDLDVEKLPKEMSVDVDMPIAKYAINRAAQPESFENLICHPTIDFGKYDVKDLHKYIDDAPWCRRYRREWEPAYQLELSDYARDAYKASIEVAIKVNNVKKTKEYYDKNGVLTLEQIYNHVNNTDCKRAINMPLNCIGETIGHFLAETHIDANDEKAIDILNEIIKKLRSSTYYFWHEDDIGRTPPMLALECENFVVAKAMMERMIDEEFVYSLDKGSSHRCCAVQTPGVDHEQAFRDIIRTLKPERREEFDNLLTERLGIAIYGIKRQSK